MKLVIIIVILLVLAGGGLFGAATFAPALVPPAILTALGMEVPEPEEPKDERPSPDQTTLIELDPISIPIFEDGDVDRFLVLHVLLEVEFGPNQAYVNEQMPRIIDALITHVHALASLDIKPGIADRQFLKERLLAKLDATIGKGYVIDILFQNLFERPLG